MAPGRQTEGLEEPTPRTGLLLLLAPAALSALVLGAHFLRRGHLLATLACLGLAGLLWVRRPWAARVVQLALVLGSLEWYRALDEITARRLREGLPYERTAIILGTVIVVALASALLLETPAVRRHFGRTRA